MKRVTCLLIFIVFINYLSVKSQVKLDSLLIRLDLVKNDTAKVNLLNTISKEYRKIDFNKSLDFGMQSLDFSKKIQFKKGEADSYLQIAFTIHYLGKYEESLEYYREALKIYEALNNKEKHNDYLNGVAKAYSGIGYVNQFKGEYDTSLVYLEKAYELFSLTGNKAKIAEVYNLMARLYVYKTINDKALECLLNAIKIYEELGDKEHLDYMKGRLGVYYAMIGDREKALKNLIIGFGNAKRMGDKNQIAHSYNNLGMVYKEMDDMIDTALNYLLNAMRLYDEIGSAAGVANSYHTIGAIYSKKNDYEKALDYYFKSLEANKKLKYKKKIGNNYFSIAQTYKQLGKLDLAKKYFQKSLDIGFETGILSMIKYAAGNKGLIHRAQKEYDEMFKCYDIYEKYDDSIKNLDIDKKIAKLEMQYEYEIQQKEKELAHQSEIKRKELVRNISVIISVFIIILGLVLFRIYRIKQRDRIQKLENDLNKYMNHALRLQMNPHFIFNTLNSVQKFIYKNDNESSGKYLAKFANLMRATLQNSEKFSIPIQEEIDTLKLYIELEALRFKEKFDFSIEIDEKIDPYNHKIPALLLQPFIENSINHGLSSKEGKGKILTKIGLAKNKILCTIEDTGIGRDEAERIKSEADNENKSLGIEITSKRIKLINQLYKINKDVLIFDLKDKKGKGIGTKVEISLPILN